MKGAIDMFRYNVRGENIEVTEAIRNYVEKKVGKLERYFSDSPEATAHVNLKVYTEKTAKVEVTIPLPYLVLRAEETRSEEHTSELQSRFDLVCRLLLEKKKKKTKNKTQ